MQETAARVIEAAKRKRIPVVMDADALLIIQREPNLVKGWDEVILTPNMVEFAKLWNSNPSPSLHSGGEETDLDKVMGMANQLWGPTVVKKGMKDYISNGTSEGTAIVDLEGGPKRSGGQGDTLTGAIATFLGWRRAYLDGLWDTHERGEKMGEGETLFLAAYAGAAVTRVSPSGVLYLVALFLHPLLQLWVFGFFFFFCFSGLLTLRRLTGLPW